MVWNFKGNPKYVYIKTCFCKRIIPQCIFCHTIIRAEYFPFPKRTAAIDHWPAAQHCANPPYMRVLRVSLSKADDARQNMGDDNAQEGRSGCAAAASICLFRLRRAFSIDATTLYSESFLSLLQPLTNDCIRCWFYTNISVYRKTMHSPRIIHRPDRDWCAMGAV